MAGQEVNGQRTGQTQERETDRTVVNPVVFEVESSSRLDGSKILTSVSIEKSEENFRRSIAGAISGGVPIKNIFANQFPKGTSTYIGPLDGLQGMVKHAAINYDNTGRTINGTVVTDRTLTSFAAGTDAFSISHANPLLSSFIELLSDQRWRTDKVTFQAVQGKYSLVPEFKTNIFPAADFKVTRALGAVDAIVDGRDSIYPHSLSSNNNSFVNARRPLTLDTYQLGNSVNQQVSVSEIPFGDRGRKVSLRLGTLQSFESFFGASFKDQKLLYQGNVLDPAKLVHLSQSAREKVSTLSSQGGLLIVRGMDGTLHIAAEYILDHTTENHSARLQLEVLPNFGLSKDYRTGQEGGAIFDIYFDLRY
jgi:hypothetical protein